MPWTFTVSCLGLLITGITTTVCHCTWLCNDFMPWFLVLCKWFFILVIHENHWEKLKNWIIHWPLWAKDKRSIFQRYWLGWYLLSVKEFAWDLPYGGTCTLAKLWVHVLLYFGVPSYWAHLVFRYCSFQACPWTCQPLPTRGSCTLSSLLLCAGFSVTSCFFASLVYKLPPVGMKFWLYNNSLSSPSLGGPSPTWRAFVA